MREKSWDIFFSAPHGTLRPNQIVLLFPAMNFVSKENEESYGRIKALRDSIALVGMCWWENLTGMKSLEMGKRTCKLQLVEMFSDTSTQYFDIYL